MASYTVESPEGKRITFEWEGPTEPTEADMEAIFAEASKGGEPAKEAPAPKSVAVQAADLVRPELSSEYPNLSAAGNVAADLFGGVTGMGDSIIEAVKGAPSALAHPIETAKGIGRGIIENPASAAGALFGSAPAMAGQLVDQIRKGDNRAPADRFADLMTAGVGASKKLPARVAASKPVQAAGKAATVAKDAAKATPGIGRVVRGVEAVASAPSKVKAKLRGKAEGLAVDAIPMTTTERRTINERNPNLGATLLDTNALPVVGTAERILDRVEDRMVPAGERVGELIEGAHQKLTKEVPAEPMLVPMRDPLRAAPASEFPPSRRAPSLFKYGEKPGFKPKGRVIDPKEIAAELQPEIDDLSRVSGAEDAVATMTKHLETLQKNEVFTLPKAQKYRQDLDKQINWRKMAADMPWAQESLYNIRSRISQKMNTIVDALEGEGELKKANRTYSDLARAEEVLRNNIPRLQRNQKIGLGDKAATAAGGAIGGPVGAVVSAGGSKLARSFGNATAARAANAASKGVGVSPMMRTLRTGALLDRPAYTKDGKLVIDITNPQTY